MERQYLQNWRRPLDADERRSEVWRTGWASLVDGLVMIFSAGFLDPDFQVRSCLKWLRRGLRIREYERRTEGWEYSKWYGSDSGEAV